MKKPRTHQSFFPSLISRHPFFDFPSLFEEESPIDWEASGLSVSEDDNSYIIEAQMPGLQANNIDITLDKGVLTIRGEREEESEEKKKWHKKASYTFFYRVALPGQVDEEADTAYKQGVLKIKFRKTSPEQAKRIQVK